MDLVESYQRVQKSKQKEKLVLNYRLSQMIANHIAPMVSKDVKVLDVWEYAPELFDDERQQVQEQRRQQELLLHKERMRAFAERFNQSRREE